MAVRGVLASVLGMLKRRRYAYREAATDHVIESFRNELWPGYKTGEGVEPDLLAQIPPSRGSTFGGSKIVVWPMVEFEADIPAAARIAWPPGRTGRMNTSSTHARLKTSANVWRVHALSN